MYEKFKTYYPALLFAVGLAVLFNLFCGASIPDNGNTTNDIRNELAEIKLNQQSTDERLGRIEGRLTNSIGRTEIVESRVEVVADRNERSKAELEASERIISESQSILQEVRKGKQQAQK